MLSYKTNKNIKHFLVRARLPSLDCHTEATPFILNIHHSQHLTKQRIAIDKFGTFKLLHTFTFYLNMFPLHSNTMY